MKLQTILKLPDCKVLVKGSPEREVIEGLLLRPSEHRYEQSSRPTASG